MNVRSFKFPWYKVIVWFSDAVDGIGGIDSHLGGASGLKAISIPTQWCRLRGSPKFDALAFINAHFE